jgi:alpha-beta hydrolase superfamily lysophospholipase
MNEGFFEADGLKLFTRSWLPQTGAVGVVVIVHGFKSHSGLYGWVAQGLVERRLAVHALDLRGHGKSDGERFYVEHFSDYVSDVAQLVSQAKERHPGLPVFLLGHSAGGVISCLYALEQQHQLAGLICESFAHQVPAPDIALTLLKGLSHVAPHAHVLNLKDEDFSRDPAFVERMKADPLIVHTPGASQTIAEMIRADERLKRDFPLITLPVLILHGTADRATLPQGSQRFYDTAGSVDKTLKLYEGHYHDLLNDLDKERVMADIIEWLTARLR